MTDDIEQGATNETTAGDTATGKVAANETMDVVFVEFTKNVREEKQFFAGISIKDILSATNGGNSFVGEKYTEYREVTYEYVKTKIRADTLEHGINSIKEKLAETYYLGSSEEK